MKTHTSQVRTMTIVRNFFHEFFRSPWFFVYMTASILAYSIYAFDTYFTAILVDRIRLFLDGKNTAEAVYQPFFWIIGLGIATWTLYRINDIATAKSQTQVGKRVYAKAFSYLHHHSNQYFTDNFSGALFKRLSRYVRTFEDFSDSIIFRITPLLVQLIFTMTVIFLFSELAGWIVFGYVAVFCGISFLLVRWQHGYVDIYDRRESEFSGYVTDTIANHSTILSFGKFTREFRRFQEKCSNTYNALYISWRKSNLMYALLGIINFASYWSITGLAIYFALHGQITFATFLLINTYNGVLADKIWDVSHIFKDISKIIADAREGMEILTTPHGITEQENAGLLTAGKGDIHFSRVNFGYGETPIFRDLNLTISAGQKVGIVGVSGSGKSTLTKLLMRLYDITS